RDDIPFIFEQGGGQVHEPPIFTGRAKGREPHLPVKPRLMRRTPCRRALHIARLPFKYVWLPVDSIGASFDFDLEPILCHHPEEPVTANDSKRLQMFLQKS